ncbi:(Fe-S)-binding protein [SAR202 cluster bacterium AD-804-J14_MRT_500m]|nr:(Fe-S)-binding protein [SAR202 cluster bacterium AD-804-J14_MRT_500m]
MNVALFVTCIVDQLYPEIGEAVVKVLRRQGVSVTFPLGQTCCGQPLFNSGYRKDAMGLARRVVEEFSDADYVVVPSGSCAAMMKIFYPELLANDTSLVHQARNLSKKIFEFSQFLVKVLGVTDVGSSFQGKVAYHPSCHLLRELGVVHEPTTLLQAIKNAELMELPDATTCCGFGGTFSVKYSDISEAILDDKLTSIERSGAEILTACDASCLMHIGGGLSKREPDTGVRTMHIAELLATEES